MADNTLFTPPRFFSEVKFHRHTDRSIGWLELFYDLVYVATLIQIGNFLSDNVSLIGFGQFAVMLSVVWWAWTGETFYQNRYVVDDLTHRLLVFIQMFAVASLGISISGAFGDLYIQFTLAYVVIRIILIIMYVRSARSHPETAELSHGYAVGFFIGILVWMGSLFLPFEIHWVGWLIGAGVELAVPLFPKMRRLQREAGVDNFHISERFGIFTIIVLGESFIKVLDEAQGAVITLNPIVFSVFGLIVLYSLWWLYFHDTAGKLINFAGRIKPFAWVYGHLPLSASLIIFGVAAKKVFIATFEHPNDALDPKYRLLYTVAIVMYLVALAIIDFGIVEEHSTRQVLIHVISAVAVGIIGVVATGLTPVWFVIIVAVVMIIQVVYDLYISYQHPSEMSGVPVHD